MDMNKQDFLKNEKINSLEQTEENYNEKYNINKELLNEYNERMKSISNLSSGEIKAEDGIKTKKRTEKDYDTIWETFIRDYDMDFNTYMGYGAKEIEEIGVKKFIDFMDWREVSDIERYKTDKIKVIPCKECHSHFTTFQFDFGLCNECKKNYDLKKFEESLVALEKQSPGSSTSMIIAFAFLDDFRKLYATNLPIEERMQISIEADLLSGEYTRDFILDILHNPDMISKFILTLNSVQTSDFSLKERIKVLIELLSNDTINADDKSKRVSEICNLKSIEKI